MIPLSTFGELLLAHLHLDIPSPLLGYSNKGRNPSAAFKLKTCVLLYNKIKIIKFLAIYYFTKMIISGFLGFFICILPTMYFWPVNYLERVIGRALTMKTGTRENSWKVRDLTWGLYFFSTCTTYTFSNKKFTVIRQIH